MINDQKYNDALQILNAIVIQDKSVNQIFSVIQKCRCEIEIGRNKEAKTSCNKIAKLMASSVLETANKKTKTKCLNEVESLMKKLIEIKKLDKALLLIESQFTSIKQFYSGEEKLNKLANLGIPIKRISEDFHVKTNSTKANECFLFLDKVLHEMQTTNMEDLRYKTIKVSCFLCYYGCCCYAMKDFTKSVEVFSNAIFHMKSIFGHDAAHYLVYGDCHYNFGNALRQLNRFHEAKQKFEQALNIYEPAKDGRNDKTKMNIVLLTTRLLHETNSTITVREKLLWIFLFLCFFSASLIVI